MRAVCWKEHQKLAGAKGKGKPRSGEKGVAFTSEKSGGSGHKLGCAAGSQTCMDGTPVISRSQAATCRFSAGKNGRHPYCSTAIFSGEVSVPASVSAAGHLLGARQVAVLAGTSTRQQCISTSGRCPAWDNFGGLTAWLIGKPFGSVSLLRYGNYLA
jgi:hypothetical protein